MRVAVLVIALLATGACSLPDRTYAASGSADARDDASAPDASADAAPIAVIVDQPALSLAEGATATVRVALSNPPPGPLGVNLVTVPATLCGVQPAHLTFDAANYANPQLVTVLAYRDPDTVDSDGVINLSAPGLPAVAMPVKVIDPDVPAIVATPTALVIDEGSMGHVTVSLRYQPPSVITVNVAISGTSDQIDVTTLTFSPSSYNVPQLVPITALHDGNTTDETSTLLLSAPGIPPATVTITNHDTRS
jgi:hypothetical protein